MRHFACQGGEHRQPAPGRASATSELVRDLDEMGVELEAGRVPLRIFNDPAIYGRELTHVFARCWVFVAHETEIPAAGDYVVRYIGEDPFIVVRDEDGQVNVLFDSCRHRGTQVCRADKGNSSHFRCPYHGWTYRNSGELVGVPQRQQAYAALATSEWGLLRAPRIDSYRGLIFASLDPNAQPLPDYLGDYRWYLDLNLGLSEGGMEVVGDPQRWWVDADWKTPAENFAGDSYHTQIVHRSLLELGLVDTASLGPAGTAYDVHVSECGGHTVSIRRAGPGVEVFFGYPEEVRRLFRPNGLSAAQFDLARGSVSHAGTVFPNLSFVQFASTDSTARSRAAYLVLRQWLPKGPGRFEAWGWILVPKGVSAAYKERAYKVGISTHGPSGSVEQDDIAVWNMARPAASVFARQVNAKLNYQMGLPGMGEAKPLTDWAGPGQAFDSNLEEGVQRTFYRTWLRWMRGDTA